MTHYQYLCWLPGKYVGGAEIYALRICQEMAQRGYLVDIVCSYRECYDRFLELLDPLTPSQRYPIRISHIAAPVNLFILKLPFLRSLHLLYWFLVYKRKIVKLNPSIIHINLPFPTRSYYFLLSALKSTARVVITFHLVPPNYRLRPRYYKLFSSSLGRATYISVSRSNQHNLAKALDVTPSTIRLIPNRPPLNGEMLDQDQKASLRSQLCLVDDAFVCTTVAALTPRKSHEDIINACRFLQVRELNIHFLFVGTGPYEAHLKSLVQQHDLTDSIHFLGHRSDVRSLLQISQLFIFPSKGEGLSFALMEAVQHNVPLIGPNTCGADEFLTPQTHYLTYTHGDSMALASCIQYAFSHYDYVVASADAAAKQLSKFNYDDMISETISTLTGSSFDIQPAELFPLS
jgi:glycosyltransferase involved in cell wall biosynthesis